MIKKKKRQQQSHHNDTKCDVIWCATVYIRTTHIRSKGNRHYFVIMATNFVNEYFVECACACVCEWMCVWRCRKHIRKLSFFLFYSDFFPHLFTCCEIFFYPKNYISSKCILSSLSSILSLSLARSLVWLLCVSEINKFVFAHAIAAVRHFICRCHCIEFLILSFFLVCDVRVHIMRAYDPLTLLLSDSSLRKFLFVNVTCPKCARREWVFV